MVSTCHLLINMHPFDFNSKKFHARQVWLYLFLSKSQTNTKTHHYLHLIVLIATGLTAPSTPLNSPLCTNPNAPKLY